MILNEMEILSKLDHPGIVKLFEVYQEPDKLIFIMELFTGSELYTLLTGKKKMPEKDVANIIRQVTVALNYMHEYSNFINSKLGWVLCTEILS